MKKFQLRIVFNQKQTWHIFQAGGEEHSFHSPEGESASLLLIEKAKTCAPVVYRRSRIFKTFALCLKRCILFCRWFVGKEKFS